MNSVEKEKKKQKTPVATDFDHAEDVRIRRRLRRTDELR